MLGVGGLLKHKPAGLQSEPYGRPVLGHVVDHQHVEGWLGDDARFDSRQALQRLGQEGHHGALIFMLGHVHFARLAQSTAAMS